MIVCSFYKFINIDDTNLFKKLLLHTCKDRYINGTFILAKEGINASFSGEKKAVQENGGIHIAKDSGKAYAKAGIDIRAMVKSQGKHKMISFSQSQLAAYEKAAQPVHQRWASKNSANKKTYEAAVRFLKELR